MLTSDVLPIIIFHVLALSIFWTAPPAVVFLLSGQKMLADTLADQNIVSDDDVVYLLIMLLFALMGFLFAVMLLSTGLIRKDIVAVMSIFGIGLMFLSTLDVLRRLGIRPWEGLQKAIGSKQLLRHRPKYHRRRIETPLKITEDFILTHVTYNNLPSTILTILQQEIDLILPRTFIGALYNALMQMTAINAFTPEEEDTLHHLQIDILRNDQEIVINFIDYHICLRIQPHTLVDNPNIKVDQQLIACFNLLEGWSTFAAKKLLVYLGLTEFEGDVGKAALSVPYEESVRALDNLADYYSNENFIMSLRSKLGMLYNHDK